MKRCALAVISLLSFLVLAAATLPATAATSTAARTMTRHAGYSSYHTPFCQSSHSTCTDLAFRPKGPYVGHDEPSVEFKSGVVGSGNTLDGNSGTYYLNPGAAATAILGNGNAIDVGSGSQALSVTGNSNTVTGTGDTLALASSDTGTLVLGTHFPPPTAGRLVSHGNSYRMTSVPTA